jgi:RND family efflux transporter MFP subunit
MTTYIRHSISQRVRQSGFLWSPFRLPVLLLVVVMAAAGCGSDEVAPSGEAHDHESPVVNAAAEAQEEQQLWTCGMHPQIVEEEPGQCPICGMNLTPMKQSGAGEGVVEIDPVTIQNIGVRTATVDVTPLQQTVRTTGRFEVNEQATAAVSPKIGGWVERLYVDYDGARVSKGQPLLEIYSPELVSTQEEYLLALRNAERLEGTAGAQDAQRLVDAAHRRLTYWDVTDEQIQQLKVSGTPTKTITLYAPASGTVTSKSVTQGQRVQAGQTLLQLTDLSRLWLMVDVYERDLAWVNVGTAAQVDLPYQPGAGLTGRVDYIYDTLDPETRTVQARITVQNPERRLKPGMYANAMLEGDATTPRPTVPSEAVIYTGERAVVVLALGDGRFRPVEVETGLEADGQTQVLAGLEGGERVVTSAQFLIDSEARLKSAVGAMMAGHDHGAGSMDGGGLPEPASDAPDAVSAEREGDVQRIDIVVGEDGRFAPAQIQLTRGVPAELTFTRHTEKTCATDVQIPAFGVETTDLPLHETVTIRFTPDESGSFTFACGMDMIEGTLLVKS